ncbi:hypothetical protein DFH08DRAFT_948659 [Mycena albidolilacea]|uniref:Uncharacterized protein n=1 Tax=Mycena albidolilacea TaxID=1033008 RepID=A0AAD7ARE9_9AGAR|nr:hypothetical protein DFH08DRAFT_948659 [Mycena albidolilacea]
MPLFMNHHTMHINACHALCLELLCTQFLPAPCQCQHGSNQRKYYVAQNIAQQNTAPPPLMQTATARPPPCPSSAVAALRPRVAGFTLSTSTRQILDTSLAQAAAAFPALCCPECELQHQLLTWQEATTCLAALTPLPPSPTLLQEEHNEALAVRLTLGTSPLPSITMPHTLGCDPAFLNNIAGGAIKLTTYTLPSRNSSLYLGEAKDIFAANQGTIYDLHLHPALNKVLYSMGGNHFYTESDDYLCELAITNNFISIPAVTLATLIICDDPYFKITVKNSQGINLSDVFVEMHKEFVASIQSGVYLMIRYSSSKGVGFVYNYLTRVVLALPVE